MRSKTNHSYRLSGIYALVLLWLLSLCLVSSSSADVVLTNDGSRIVGRIERIVAGKLIIVTDIAGTLEIDASKVISLSTEGQVNVEFATGDRLLGVVEMTEENAGTVMHTGLGTIDISEQAMTSLWPEGEDSPNLRAIRRQADEERERLKPQWSTFLEAGGVLKEGNTNTFDARGRLDVTRKTPSDLLDLFLTAEFSEQNDLRSNNEVRGGVRYEALYDEQKYWYVRVEMEYDEFENLDLRSTAAVGLGKYWIKTSVEELKTSYGIGYRHEAFSTGLTNDSAVVDLGLDYRVDVAPWVQLTHATKFSPGLEDFDDYRVDFDTALVFPFQNEDVKLKVGMRNEYNSRPPTGIVRLDNTFYANIVLKLR